MISLLFAVVIRQFSLHAAAEDVDAAIEAEESADGAHIITIFDGKKHTSVRTDAATVREALLRANVELDTGDKIEPALDESISANNFNINIYRSRSVLVIDGSRRYRIRTASTNPIDVASDAGIEMLDADIAKIVPYNNILESGDMIAYQVMHAKTVNLNYYGKELSVRTQAKTVAAFLKEQKIDTDAKKNWISVAKDTAIKDGIHFSIQPQGLQTITVDETIKFKETTTYDYALEYGKREVIKTGKNGKKTVTYEVNMKDGMELSRKLISEIVTQPAVQQEVKVGMKTNLPAGTHNDWMTAAGIPESEWGFVNFIITRESHWNPLARNRSSGATGLCQALPGKKMASAGADWATNPITQLKWCNGYAKGRYGSWEKAYQFWTKHHWW